MDEDGHIYRGDIEVGKHTEEFFTKVYESNQAMIQTNIFDNFQPTVTSSMNTVLTSEIIDLEIKQAINSIGSDRAPGPDGLTVHFYQECWDIIGPDVTKEIKEFFETSHMKKGINHTNICMIPKVEKPTTLSNYRPISLCNVLYKIISNILVNRLKLFLDKIVSESQAAFISGRIITDNNLIAHELMHSLKSRKKPPKHTWLKLTLQKFTIVSNGIFWN